MLRVRQTVHVWDTCALHCTPCSQVTDIPHPFTIGRISRDSGRREIVREGNRRFACVNSPWRNLNLNLPVLDSLAQHETSALANYATEAVSEWSKVSANVLDRPAEGGEIGVQILMDGEQHYNIRIATEDDYDAIFNFLRYNFFCDDPLNLSMGTTHGPDDPKDIYSMGFIREGKTFIAVTTSSSGRETVVGACINSEGTPASCQGLRTAKETMKNLYVKKVLTLIDRAEEVADIWNRFGLDRRFDLRILCVSRAMRGRGLGRILVERSLWRAKKLGYSLAHIECTGLYSANIVKSLGFECVFKIPYSEYRGEDGKVNIYALYGGSHFRSRRKQQLNEGGESRCKKISSSQLFQDVLSSTNSSSEDRLKALVCHCNCPRGVVVSASGCEPRGSKFDSRLRRAINHLPGHAFLACSSELISPAIHCVARDTEALVWSKEVRMTCYMSHKNSCRARGCKACLFEDQVFIASYSELISPAIHCVAHTMDDLAWSKEVRMTCYMSHKNSCRARGCKACLFEDQVFIASYSELISPAIHCVPHTMDDLAWSKEAPIATQKPLNKTYSNHASLTATFKAPEEGSPQILSAELQPEI
uniref:aralkylamine N-acetyltransferase n=1 Tax=Timema tahoe TaxID=61484 RepID=A0A7R9IAA9_9NEOP|nr:unnamed protein product [Timema tahoe]